ncbi:hypothetical protein CRE_14336 [Caenorhabditis remanei]|uniref:Uncharacterized protein n=1 Tax=Caenorhabditis remanei TaxID=31234 RepID=E3NH82_CAERE|nr:hypothetical protein CRE_14336 [Caenorhabditis remanei]
MASNMPPKRDPKEPTPLVLMNPELRVRQLRYAANIEATLMVPLHRYYEVLLDLSQMGLEYLKAMKLERAFIIFKRIEYFVFHRLVDHPGVATFTSAAKSKIMARVPMIMFVAQQIIVEFVMPVYERQAAYFRYEELQRRLRILNATAWQSIRGEAARREAEFYAEAEAISTRFGVELASFLPMEVIPDDNHPSNYPPRTYPAKKKVPGEITIDDAIQAAIDSMNTNVGRSAGMEAPLAGEQPVEALIRNVNAMMNDALTRFFRMRQQANGQQQSSSSHFPTEASTQAVNHKKPDDQDVILVIPDQADRRNTYSPTVDHMYRMPQVSSSNYVPTVNPNTKNPMEYNPVYSLETYVELLQKTFDANSKIATGYHIVQLMADKATSPSTAGYMLHLQPIGVEVAPPAVEGRPGRSFLPEIIPNILFGRVGAGGVPVPEPDPGPPRADPPTQPIAEPGTQDPEQFGIWVKKGAARTEGVGSLGVLSNLDRAREVLDTAPPMPAGIDQVGAGLPPPEQQMMPQMGNFQQNFQQGTFLHPGNPPPNRKRTGQEESQEDFIKRMTMSNFNQNPSAPGPSGY